MDSIGIDNHGKHLPFDSHSNRYSTEKVASSMLGCEATEHNSSWHEIADRKGKRLSAYSCWHVFTEIQVGRCFILHQFRLASPLALICLPMMLGCMQQAETIQTKPSISQNFGLVPIPSIQHARQEQIEQHWNSRNKKP